MKKYILRASFILLFFLCGCVIPEAGIYIRINQVGYLPTDEKTAIVIAKEDISKLEYLVYNTNGKIADRGTIGTSKGKYGEFNFSYEINFSNLRSTGSYSIQIGESKSPEFKIGRNIFNQITDSLLTFYKVQRCGYTSPYLHGLCHTADATSLIGNEVQIDKTYDVTGGWHDAGDYTKFLNTTAFATYMMLFSYEFDPVKFGFDHNKNNIPDILEEAKVGLDWLIRASYNNKFITQVQNEKDQDVGWRLPEDDPLQFDRPAFVGIGKNLIGIYVATMSLASRIWRDVVKYDEFADQCLKLAENYYSLRDAVPDIATSGTGVYVDQNYEGKMALGAVELFSTTGRNNVLDEAVTYADAAQSDYWWSWGDINILAHYKLSKYDNKYIEFLKNNLVHFSQTADSTIFGRGVEVSWGTNHAILGVTLQNILYSKISNDRSFNSLAIKQRDYILGRNPWGVSFISGFGETRTENFHHQVAYFNNGKLPGALAAGPIPKSILNDYEIEFEKRDRFAKFQTKEVVYIDDRMDYISNEPTISSNATAIFVMGYFSSRQP